MIVRQILRAPVDRARLALLASDDVAIQAFKAAHDKLHAAWDRHSRYCLHCAFGGECRTANDLAKDAEAAGWRWQEAERRHTAAIATQRALDEGIAW